MREFRIYRKGFLSSEKILTSPESGVLLPLPLVGKKLVVTVTAVDEEGLESAPSVAVEIRPPAAPAP
jgi:hypothetical protein